jgi:hypothetical protein
MTLMKGCLLQGAAGDGDFVQVVLADGQYEVIRVHGQGQKAV